MIDFGIDVTVYDPWIDLEDVSSEHGITVLNNQNDLKSTYSAIILAVGHTVFQNLNISKLRSENSIVYDIKGFLPDELINYRL